MGAKHGKLGISQSMPSTNDVRTAVNFTINGESYTVDPEVRNDEKTPYQVDPQTRLVDYIRDKAHLTGTKFMCREGGCGACVITVRSTDPVSGQTVTRAVNSCLTPVLSCDGWEVTTVESLGNQRDGLHPIQNELFKSSGTQCGYCTPGMVMNMYSLLESHKELDSEQVEASLDGNICRCTGYRPILDAFKAFASDAPEDKRACDIEECMKCPMRNGNGINGIGSKGIMVNGENGLCSKKNFKKRPSKKVQLSFGYGLSSTRWVKVYSLADLQWTVLECKDAGLRFRLVAGNTSTGIYKDEGPYGAFVDIMSIPELNVKSVEPKKELVFGAGVTLAAAIEFLKEAANTEGFEYVRQLSQHIQRIANTPVRNVGTLGGNLMIKHNHPEFPSDIFVLLETIGAGLKVVSEQKCQNKLLPNPKGFMDHKMDGHLLISIHLPALIGSEHIFQSYKITQRYLNSHAYVNAGFLMKIDKGFRVLGQPRIVFGGVSPKFIHAAGTEDFLNGKVLTHPGVIKEALKILGQEVNPNPNPPDASPEYRRTLTQSLLYKFVLKALGPEAKTHLQTGGQNIQRKVTSGKQVWDTDEKEWPINKPIKKLEAVVQLSGEAEFVNDIEMLHDELHGAFVLSKVGRAQIASIDPSEALRLPGVVRFIQAKDIPGVNDYFAPIFNPKPTKEEIFAESEIIYAGQSIGLIVAQTHQLAVRAAKLVQVKYKNSQKPITSIAQRIQEAKDNGVDLLSQEEKFPVPSASPDGGPVHVISGQFHIGSQYHFHMETQTCLCVPKEDGMDVVCPTQWMDFLQHSVSKAINMPNHEINVTVRRLGGSYGAKAGRTGQIAAACAVAASLTNRPVRIVLDLGTNMEMIGKRTPYFFNYEVCFDDSGKILHLDAQIYLDSGATANEETADHAKGFMQNCYQANNWSVATATVQTNTAPNTYCRAPATTQGIALIEMIMEHIGFTLNLDPVAVRLNNILATGDPLFPTPSSEFKTFEGPNYIPDMIQEIMKTSNYEGRQTEIKEFNKSHRWRKRGLALVPMKYRLQYLGLSYIVYVAVYKSDGTVVVSHAGAECGQGINTKVAAAVAATLGVPVELVRVKPSNNLVAPNAGPTGGSWTSELTCYAALIACQTLVDRMKPIREKLVNPTWEEVITNCWMSGIDLSASYKCKLSDPIKEYDIWGVNVTEVEVDVLTGEFKIARLDLLEDAGKSLNPEIDLGQVEGALVMGLGMWTTEKCVYDTNTGQLLTAGTWDYKPPLARDIPEDLRVTLLQNAPNPYGVLKSKATGEPPVCTSICVLFALQKAIASARKDAGNTDWFAIGGPISPEDIVKLSLTSPEHFEL